MNLTSSKLPERTLRKFKWNDVDADSPEDCPDLIQLGVNTNMFVPALLTERGLKSNQIYRADVNHRNIDYFSLMNRHSNNQEAIAKSFANPNSSELFDSQAMFLFVHSMVPIDSDEEVDTLLRLKAQKTAKLPDDLGTNSTMRGYIDGAKLADISNADFKRVLEIFGLYWVDKQSEPVGDDVKPRLIDISGFLHLFKSHTIHTPEGFKAFLTAFQFDNIFVYDDSKDVVTNANEFGWLLRSLTSLRFSPCEGQHRWWCFSSFIQGFPVAANTLPLPFTKLEDYEERFQCIESWQIRKKNNIKVVYCKDSLDRKTIEQCKRFSTAITQGQKVQKQWNYFAFLADMCTKLRDDWASENMESVSFDTFWKAGTAGCITSNTSKAWKIMREVIENDPTPTSSVEFVQSREKWDKWKKEIDEEKLEKRQAPGITKRHPASKYGKNLWVFLTLINGFMDSEHSLNLVPDLAEVETWPDQRDTRIMEAAHIYRSFWFMEKVLWSVLECQFYIEARLWIEQKLILLFRKDYKQYKDAVRHGIECKLEVHPIPADGRAGVSEWNALPDNVDIQQLKQSDIGSRTCRAVNKIAESYYCVMLQSVFRAMIEHGYDCKLFSDDVTDKAAKQKVEQFYDRSVPGQHNYSLKLYLSNDYAKMIPVFKHRKVFAAERGARPMVTHSFQPETDSDHPVKRTMETLLELLPYYVKIQKELAALKLDILKECYGVQNREGTIVNGANFKPNSDGFHESLLAASMTEEVRKREKDIKWLIEGRFTMEHFIEDIKSGAFNTDRILAFVDHVERSTSQNIKTALIDYFDEDDPQVVHANEFVDETGGLEVEVTNTTPKLPTKLAVPGGSVSVSIAKKTPKNKRKNEDDDTANKTPKKLNAKAHFLAHAKEADSIDLVRALGRLAWFYKGKYDTLFSIKFTRSVKINYGSEKEQELWNLACDDIGASLPNPAAGFGENQTPAVIINKEAKTLKAVMSLTRETPQRKKARKKTDKQKKKTPTNKCTVRGCRWPNEEADVTCSFCNMNPIHEKCANFRFGGLFCESCGSQKMEMMKKSKKKSKNKSKKAIVESDEDSGSEEDDDDDDEDDDDDDKQKQGEESDDDEDSDDDGKKKEGDVSDDDSEDSSQEDNTELPLPDPTAVGLVDTPQSKTSVVEDVVEHVKCSNPLCQADNENCLKCKENLCPDCNVNYSHPECFDDGKCYKCNQTQVAKALSKDDDEAEDDTTSNRTKRNLDEAFNDKEDNKADDTQNKKAKEDGTEEEEKEAGPMKKKAKPTITRQSQRRKGRGKQK